MAKIDSNNKGIASTSSTNNNSNKKNGGTAGTIGASNSSNGDNGNTNVTVQIQNTTTTTKSRFRLFGGNKNKKIQQQQQQQQSKSVNTNNTNNNINNEFSLDAVGKVNTIPSSATVVAKQSTKPTTTAAGTTTTTTTTATTASGTSTGSHLIPLVPLQDALTIDSTPIGRAEDTVASSSSVVGGSSNINSNTQSNNKSILKSNTTSSSIAKSSLSTTSASTTTRVTKKKKLISNVKRSWSSILFNNTYTFQKICNTVFTMLQVLEQNNTSTNTTTTTKRSKNNITIDFTSIDKLYESILLIQIHLQSYYGGSGTFFFSKNSHISRSDVRKYIIQQRYQIRIEYINQLEFFHIMSNIYSYTIVYNTIYYYTIMVLIPIIGRYLLYNVQTIWYPQLYQSILASDQYAILLTLYDEFIIDYNDSINIYYNMFLEYKTKLVTNISQSIIDDIQNDSEILLLYFYQIPQYIVDSIYLYIVCSIVFGMYYIPTFILILDPIVCYYSGIY